MNHPRNESHASRHTNNLHTKIPPPIPLEMTSFNEQKIQQALEDLDAQRFPSVRAAAKAHNVPFATLNRRSKGGISRQEARSTQQLLSQHQEELLVKWILDLEAGGFAPSHAQLREMAGLVSKDSGGPDKVGNNWVDRFLKRHPEIHTKTGVKIDDQKLRNTTPEALEAWFEGFKKVKDDNQVEDADTWNMDETGIALGVCVNQTVVGSSSTTRSYKKSPENREWVSIMEAASAAGKRTRSLAIFKGKSVQSSWFKHGEMPDSLYTTSENGWTSNDIGLRWLREVLFNIDMLRLALRTNVPKLQPHKLTRVTCKPGYHLFCIALLTPGKYQHRLKRE